MPASEFCITVIATFEQFRATVYPDAAGKPTIGYGHLIKAGEEHLTRTRLTVEQARDILLLDTRDAAAAVRQYAPQDRLWPHQVDALISWTFNCGPRALQTSTMLQRIKENASPPVVAEQMIRWVHSGGKRQGGLVRRRHCEAVWFLGAPQAIVLSLAKEQWK